mgnify:CR=1 FL=1
MAMNIMIQGTMSNAGKSLLAAGLCRVLKQDGYRVAPFKSQNMALNSFITAEGGEMGRAQVVQAEAAGIEPDTRMNPILLKPTTDVGSQVIVNGQVRGNMQAMEYFRRKRDYIPAVLEAYNSLASEYDVIVIEGAGSPAEINLKQDDFVNMGLAKLVDAPVLLVGDIDRGGVFASLYGTVKLLDEDEQARICGLVINKFRGDVEILRPGLTQLEELTGKKFDEAKFEAACKHANRTAQNWLKVCDYLQYKPAPMSGFDLFNHMADVVTARGKEAAADAFDLLAQDLEQNIKEGTSTLPFPEKYRVMFEGIPCWPKLPNLFKPLKENGVNVTAVVYAPAFGFVYNNMDEMARAYYKAPNSVCIEQGVAWREGICRDNKVDGVLVHYNRSCKPWSGYMAEMQRRFTKDLGVPCAGFDGDQADPRNFNEAQYATRVQGLVEAMEANKKD